MIGEDVRKVTIHFEKLMEKRIMEFQTNIFEGVEPPSSSKYNLIGTKLPTSQDVYFVSKWHELFERYEMARIFLSKTEEDNWTIPSHYRDNPFLSYPPPAPPIPTPHSTHLLFYPPITYYTYIYPPHPTYLYSPFLHPTPLTPQLNPPPLPLPPSYISFTIF